MKYFCGIILLHIVMYFTLNANQRLAKVYYIDSSKYDVHFYHLNLKVTTDSLYISGNTKIIASSKDDSLNMFYIQLNNALSIDSVTFMSQKCSFTHSDNWIKVQLPNIVKKNNKMQFVFYYKGFLSNSSNLMGSGIDSYDNGCKVFYTLSEPFSALDFFPCKQWLEDKADSVAISITTTKNLLAVANGLLRKKQKISKDLVTYHWHSGYPTAYYLIGFAVGNFKEYFFSVQSISGVSFPIQNYLCIDNDELDAEKENILRHSELIKFFEKLLETPYPFSKEKYGTVMAPIGGGMENQTITVLNDYNFGLVAHELAHSWFGNLVTCATWQDIWINEGFATYLTYLAVEKFFPDETQQWLISCAQNAMRYPNKQVYIDENEMYNELRIFNGSLTYMKGAYILHMLRYQLGDKTFFKVLQLFLKKYAFKNAGVFEFKKLAEEISKKNLDDFFRQWYYGKGYPIVYIKGEIKSHVLSLEVFHESSSNENYFNNLNIEAKIILADNTDTLIIINSDTTKNYYSYKFTKPVRQVIVDPFHWILAKFKVEIISKEYNDGSLFIYPNPFDECFNLYTLDNNSTIREINIFNLSGIKQFQIQTNSNYVRLCPFLSKGTYIIQVNGQPNNYKYTSKLIKR